MSRETLDSRTTPRRLRTATAALTVAAATALVLPALTTPGLGTSAEASAAPAAPAVERNLTAEKINLGTLGGKHSAAKAVNGSVVVGWAQTGRRGERHAFAYDLAAKKPRMRDLGSLEGHSEAEAVDGSIVVGMFNADSQEDNYRAFAYDLAADEPAMLDLGTLGGTYARAIDVSGSLITGFSETASGERHAFAYDLGAAVPVMRDLGTLGGAYSTAEAVAGTVIVGSAATGGPGDFHAFSYDLAADEPAMQDLGTLGEGRSSYASAVAGGIVTGQAGNDSGEGRAFAYDLAADAPAMRDLGTLGGRGSVGYALDGATVVGSSGTTSGDLHAYAQHLAADEPAMQDLGTMRGSARSMSRATAIDGDLVIGRWGQKYSFVYDLGSDAPVMYDLSTWKGTYVEDVDGDVVVGSARQGSRERATAWVLRETTRPMFAFTRITQPAVGERAGRVKIRVTRYGRTNRAVSVRYRTHGHSATAGQDFVATSGTLRFPRGVTRRSFTVKIKNDRLREYEEYFVVRLLRPSSPAVLGTPNWSYVRIKPSDR